MGVGTCEPVQKRVGKGGAGRGGCGGDRGALPPPIRPLLFHHPLTTSAAHRGAPCIDDGHHIVSVHHRHIVRVGRP